MQSDSEVFGLGKKQRRLKPGETGNEFDDFEYVDPAPNASPTGSPSTVVEPYEAPPTEDKQPKPYNEDASSQTKPVDRVMTTPPPAPTPAATPTVTPAASSANVGHDGTYNGMTREQWRDAWMSSGVNSVQGAKDWFAKNGGQWLSDNGQVATPFGETLDLGGNARGSLAGNGPLKPSWTPVGGDAGTGSADPLAALIASQGAGAPTTAAPVASAPGANSLEALLASQLAGGVDADPAVAAYRRSAARDFGKLRADEAEQAAQDGTVSSGGQEGRIRQLQEGEAEAVAGFAGSRAADVQRLQVQQDQFLKSLGFNYAQLDAQQKQFLANLGQNKDQFLASLGLSELQLNAQQKNALDQLNLSWEQLRYQANRDATLAATGGAR